MLLAALLSYAGFMGLCLSLDRHHQDLLKRKPSARLRLGLRLGGWLLLALSLWAAVSVSGWSFGLVEWSAVLMLSALVMVVLMPYQPRLVLLTGAVSVLISPVVALL